MTKNDSNIVSLVSALCKSLLEEVCEDFSVNECKRFTRRMLTVIFQYNERVENKRFIPEVSLSFLTIKRDSCGLRNVDDVNLHSQITDCGNIFEDLDGDECNCLKSVLQCLYILSKSNPISTKILKESNHEHTGLFLNSENFNDINWNVFSYHELSNDQDLFNYTTSPWFLYSEDQCLNCDSLDDFMRASAGKCELWDFHSIKLLQNTIQDEGFVTPGSEFGTESTELINNSSSSDISTYTNDGLMINNVCFSQARLAWEHLGAYVAPQEPKFVSEIPESIIQLWKVWNALRHTMVVSLPIGIECNFECFKSDINHLLFGVPSNSFYVDSCSKRFYPRKGIYMKSITPEGLSSFCEPFIECGYFFYALNSFLNDRLKLSFGPVHQAFCERMKTFLQLHRFCVLNIKWAEIHQLLQLEQAILPLRRKLYFVSNLCLLNPNSEFRLNFPSRVQLLDYLYDNLIKIETSEFKFLLFYFFESCCNAYLKIASEWIFKGSFSNSKNYDEFFIHIDRDLEMCWDWRRVGYIRIKEKEIPKFVQKYYKDIFACGRSVNLLNLFSKKDVSEAILPRLYPTIQCCFNANQLTIYTNVWKMFQKRIYKKCNWNITLKDRLGQGSSIEYFERIRRNRKEWFDKYENEIFKSALTKELGHRTKLESKTNSTTTKGSSSSEHIKQVADYYPVIPEKISAKISDSISIEKTISSMDDIKVNIDVLTQDRDWGSGDHGSTKIDALINVSADLSAYSGVVHDGSGDATCWSQPISHTFAQIEYQQNKQKSVTSDYQVQLSTPVPKPTIVEEKNTQLSVRAQNKLKIMSTTYQQTLQENTSCGRLSNTETIRNEMNIMNNEYHRRLLNIESGNLLKTGSPFSRPLNEYEINRSKAMTSEYHKRLQESVSEIKPLANESANNSSNELYLSEYSVALNESEALGTISSEIVAISADEKINVTSHIEEDVSVINDKEQEQTGEEVVTIIENNSKLNECDLTEEVDDSRILSNYSDLFAAPLSTTIDELIEKANNVKNVDTTSVLYYLMQSIAVPLRIQTQLANEAILWIFIEQEKYLNHLTILRNYLLLRKPEFSLQLTSSLFEMAEGPNTLPLLLNSYTLQNVLQRALTTSNMGKMLNFERNLKLDIEESTSESSVATDVEILRRLSMSYSVEWPLNVLITEPIMKKYTRLFKFLIQIQRASWALMCDFREMKNIKCGKSEQFIQIQLYRHNMLQIVRVIQQYVTREAFEQCWNELVNYLKNSKIDLDVLYLSHLKYINKIMQRCCFCEESIPCHKAILSLLTSVLKYHNALQIGSWKHNVECNFLFHINYKSIHAAYQEYQKNLGNVRAILKSLVFMKQKIYLQAFYLELCNYS